MMQWHKQPKETSKAYQAFSTYLELGPSRSVDAAYRKAKGKQNVRAPSGWQHWYDLNTWRDRAEAYDQHLALLEFQNAEIATKQKAEAALARKEKLLQAELELAARLLDRARKILEKDLKRCTYSDAARMVEVADKILRLSNDMATEKLVLDINRTMDMKIDFFLDMIEERLPEDLYQKVLEAMTEKRLN